MLFFFVLLTGIFVFQIIKKNNWLKQEFAKQEVSIRQKEAVEKLDMYIKLAESESRVYAFTGNKAALLNFNLFLDSINNIPLQSSVTADKTGNNTPYSKLELLFKQKIAFMKRVNNLALQNRDSAISFISGVEGAKLSDSIRIYKQSILHYLQEQINQSKAGFWKEKTANNNKTYYCLAALLLVIVLSFFFLLKETISSKRIEKELELQKERYRTTLSSMAEGVITTDKEGDIVYMNPAAEMITGWKKQEAKNLPLHRVYDVSVEATGRPVDNIVSRILKDGLPVELENNTVLKTKHREELIINNSGTPLFDSSGYITGAVLVFNDITAEKKSKLQLKESEEKYRNLIEQAADGIFILDQQGRFIDVNSSGCSMMGYSKEEVLQLNLTDITPAEFITKMPVNVPDLISGKTLLVERQYKRKDGTIFYAEASAKLIAGGKIQSIVRDITQRKKAEEALKQSEERYRFLIEQATDGVIVYSYDGTIYDFNKAVYKQAGYSKEEFKALKLADLLSDGPVIVNADNVARVQAGETVLFTRKMKRKNGSSIEIEINSRVLPDGRILAFVRDVTERKQAEIKLQKALDRYNILAKATSDTIWDWDMQTHLMSYNGGITTMFGYEKPVVENIPDWWKQNIHPDDFAGISELLKEVFQLNKQTFQLSYRFRCADGSYKYIYDRAFVMYDESGKPIRLIGAMQDVTYQKEEEIRISKAIVDAQETERQQLGMELHDNVNQILSVSLLYLGIARQQQKNTDGFSETIDTCKKHISEAIDEIRKLSHQLAPTAKDEVSFKDVFASLIDSLTRNSTVEVHLYFDEFEPERISYDIQTTLYRILQEQMNNVFKYAAANSVEIDVLLRNEVISLRIADNGKGFDPKSVSKGIGLGNIKRRAEMYGGKYSCYSSPGHGCEIVVAIPLKNEVV